MIECAVANLLEVNGVITNNDWTWPLAMDAVVAAPESHKVLFENDDARVLEVIIPPGEREPEHTHRMPSIMIVDRPAMIQYYQGSALIFFFATRSFSAGNCWAMDGARKVRTRSRTWTSAPITPFVSN